MGNFCSNCGRKLEENAKYCTQCGTPCATLVDYNVGLEQKNNNKIPIIIGCVFAALVAVVLIIVFAFVKYGYDKKNAVAEDISVDEITEEAEFVEETDSENLESEQLNDIDGETADASDGVSNEECQPVYTHEFELYYEDVTWTEAKEKCEEMGGHLATAADWDEFSEIVDYLDNTGAREDTKLQVWFGGYCKDGQYVWVDDKPMSYDAWIGNEPSYVDANTGDAEEYMCYSYNKDMDWWGWNDVPNDISTWWSGHIAYLCEWDYEVSEYGKITVDHSIKSSQDKVIGYLYYERPFFKEAGAAFDKMNETMKKANDDYWEQDDVEDFKEMVEEAVRFQGEYDLEEYPYSNCINLGSVYMDDKYVSVLESGNWFAGGTGGGLLTGYNFNRSTGEQVKLYEVLGVDKDTCKAMVVDATMEYINDVGDDMFDLSDNEYSAKTIVNNYNPDDYVFYMDGESVYVIYQKYEIGPGAVGECVISIPR